MSRVSTAGLEVYSSSGGDVLADLVGYYKGVGVGATAPVPRRPPAAGDRASVLDDRPVDPRLNGGRTVVVGIELRERRSTPAGSGTGPAPATSATTAPTWQRSRHRTSAGGPFYFLDRLKSGDRIYVSTGDQRTYVYTFNRRELTSKNNAQILAATRRLGGESLSLIACTVGYDRSKSRYPDAWAPTSLAVSNRRDIRARVLDRRHRPAVTRRSVEPVSTASRWSESVR